MANRVFEDRLGLWIISPANLPARLPGIAAFGIKDVFLPRDENKTSQTHMAEVREAGLYAHLWAAVDGLSARDYANRTLLDIQRLTPGAVELNIELGSDPPLRAFIREAVTLIRSKRKSLRLRINVAPWKGFALPADLLSDGSLRQDPNLYACEQHYEGNMDNLLSAEDVAADMRAYGVPDHKATVMYAAHCRVLGSPERVRTLPDLSRLHRGVIYQDDLMADAGLL